MEKEISTGEKYFKEVDGMIVFSYNERFDSEEYDCLNGEFEINHYKKELDKLKKYGEANLLGKYCSINLKEFGNLIRFIFSNSTKSLSMELNLEQLSLTA